MEFTRQQQEIREWLKRRRAIMLAHNYQPAPIQDVADLVHSWNPEIIITTGDNNYYSGEASTIAARGRVVSCPAPAPIRG